MGEIIVFGSINMDIVVVTGQHPQLGETVFGDERHFIPGGKGGNQAVAAARLGGAVQLIARYGEDAFGRLLRAFLESESLDLTYVHVVDEKPTGIALITVNSSSENTIVVVPGANRSFTPQDVAEINIGPNDSVVSQFEVPQPVIKALFSRARVVGANTILNPAPAEPFVKDLLPTVSHLVVNETELAFFSGNPLTDDMRQIAQDAHVIGVAGQAVIVTLGRRGLLCVQDENQIHIDGHDVAAIDTTGAGDCFVGALAVGLSENMELRTALEFANRAASLSVQRLGATSSLPYRLELV